MNLKNLQRGAIGGDSVALLVGGAALGALFVYSAFSGYELPFWPALAVTAVNLIAAGRLVWAVIQTKRRRQ